MSLAQLCFLSHKEKSLHDINLFVEQKSVHFKYFGKVCFMEEISLDVFQTNVLQLQCRAKE
jgi:hypothetical protein